MTRKRPLLYTIRNNRAQPASSQPASRAIQISSSSEVTIAAAWLALSSSSSSNVVVPSSLCLWSFSCLDCLPSVTLHILYVLQTESPTDRPTPINSSIPPTRYTKGNSSRELHYYYFWIALCTLKKKHIYDIYPVEQTCLK